MKVGFFLHHLSERGTTTALLDYARGNKQYLGNTSYIFYPRYHVENFPLYKKALVKEFGENAIQYNDYEHVEELIAQHKIEVMYNIHYGNVEQTLFKSCKNAIHAVFTCQVYGDSYALVSKWLQLLYNAPHVPIVPHMINNVDIVTTNLRSDLCIPIDSTVYGCYGGKTSFDIAFVKHAIIDIVESKKYPQLWFIFMNIEPFCKNANCVFLPGSIDWERKAEFINTCDAMIHARHDGETFGLAIGEFSIRNKPIITFDGNNTFYNCEHLRILGKKAILYYNYETIYEILTNFKPDTSSDYNCYREFSPQKVMDIFKHVFLTTPATRLAEKIKSGAVIYIAAPTGSRVEQNVIKIIEYCALNIEFTQDWHVADIVAFELWDLYNSNLRPEMYADKYRICFSAECDTIMASFNFVPQIKLDLFLSSNPHGNVTAANWIYHPTFFQYNVNDAISPILEPKINDHNFCFMYSQSYPHRDRYYHLFSQKWFVHSYGKCLNNSRHPQNTTKDSQTAVHVYKTFKFVLAIENAFDTNYFTEKALDASLAGSIAIYWGDPSVFKYINKRRLLYIPDFTTDELLLARVEQILHSPEMYDKIIAQPIWNEGYNVKNFFKNLATEFTNIISN